MKQLALWSEEMNFEQVDRAPEDRLNRVLWHAMRGSHAPYPQWAIGADAEEEEEEEAGEENKE
jgi:hypothetical protein